MKEASYSDEKTSLSRRSFLTGAGLAAGGIVVGSMMPGLTGIALADDATSATSSTGTQIFDGVKLSEGHIVHDPDLCAGCRECEIVCSLNKWGVVNPELSNIRIHTDILGGYISEAYACKQCAGAECVAVCPTKANHVDETTGARVIDPTLCTGCKLCMEACPCTPSRIHYNAAQNICFKCDLCGGEPKCVAYCPAGALSSSWVEAAADANTIKTASGIDTKVDSGSVTVLGNIASTYTQPFTAKIKASYFNSDGDTLNFSQRLELEVDTGQTVPFEDVFETTAPKDVKKIRLEIMCGKIAG